MTPERTADLKQFLIRLGATAAAVVIVMYLAKAWFVDPQHPAPPPSAIIGEGVGTQASQPELAPGKVGVISWRDAAKHYGEYATVEGTIVATHNSGKACFFNFHPDYKRYFTAVIFASAFPRFPRNPEHYYYGKKVRVSGYIKEYKGKPEIILNDPSQIEILNEG